MTQNNLSLADFYKGWDAYQQLLITAVTPLTAEQLALRPAPHMWSVGMLAQHIVATRVWWFHMWLGVGDASLAPLDTWDEDGMPARSASELVTGLETTWRMIQDALTSWTPADLEQMFKDPRGRPIERSRQWIIWHLLEHDLHHGGELSLILGMHHVPALDL